MPSAVLEYRNSHIWTQPAPLGCHLGRVRGPMSYQEFEGERMRHTGQTLLLSASLAALTACGGGQKGDGSAGNALPENPGPNAYLTVSGIDANANGVRDEVELQLHSTYQSDPPALAGAMMSAQAYQRILNTDPGNAAAALASIEASSKAAGCMLQRLSNNGSKASAIVTYTYFLSYNTPARIAQRKAILAVAKPPPGSADSAQSLC
jgi:hypothetical protein